MWKDTTSYSKYDKDRKPTAFTAKFERVKITVTCGHIHYKPNWIFHCFALGMDTIELPKGITELDAKLLAIKAVRRRLQELSSDLEVIELATS